MAHFPLFIDIKDRICLVAGGGQVALRKARTLTAYGARVRVVAEDICQEICDLVSEEDRRTGQVTDRDMEDALLVVAATGSRSENSRIAAFCNQRKIPVNVVDEPRECTFLFPAVVKRGDISIGINSGAKSPGVSRKIRRQIEEIIPDYYEQINDQIGNLRPALKEKVAGQKERGRILDSVAREAFAAKRPLTPEEIRQITGQEQQ